MGKSVIGTYKIHKQKKGEQEYCGEDLDDGQLYFTVILLDGSRYDTLSQDTAEIIAGITRLELLLKKKKTKR